MGRNLIPKLGEWRDGERYSFRYTDGSTVLSADNGLMIVYELETARQVRGENEKLVLAAVYADGLQSVMAAMYDSGYTKGLIAGKQKAKEEIKKALGLND